VSAQVSTTQPGRSQIDRQESLPLAVIDGKAMSVLPEDLYIPPDSLRVFLDSFEGPLDLLLYLIKRQNIDIGNIAVAVITDQYVQYIDMMDELKLDLAGEYLLMAAMLAEIKSRILLPRRATEGAEEEADPQATLIRRLQEYERYKQSADDIDSLPRCERDIWLSGVDFPDRTVAQQLPQVDMQALATAFAEVLARIDTREGYVIKRELLSVRERMTAILDHLNGEGFTDFSALFNLQEGRSGAVVVLLAVLELLKTSLIEMVQNEFNGPIYLKVG
jgi:segregation and condensation protein A